MAVSPLALFTRCLRGAISPEEYLCRAEMGKPPASFGKTLFSPI